MKPELKRTTPNKLREHYSKVKEITTRQIAVGFPAGKTSAYPDSGMPVAEVAAMNVFGIGVPQRDFMAVALPNIIDRCGPILERIVKESSGKASAGAVAALEEAAGQTGASAIKDAITDGVYLPIAESTYESRKAKGRDSREPLIDSAHMISQVTYVARERR